MLGGTQPDFWNRNAFFLIVEGGLFSVLVTLDDGGSDADIVQQADTVLPLLGGLIALAWIWIASWSVVWISRWWKAFLDIEGELDPWHSHRNAGRGIQRASAVQGAALFIPALFLFGWIAVSWASPVSDFPTVGHILVGSLILVGALLVTLMWNRVWFPRGEAST